MVDSGVRVQAALRCGWAELQEDHEEKAERLVKEELARRKWAEEDLAGKPKTHRDKAGIALRLRRESTMTLAWIAGRLQMGSVNTLKNTLRLANSRDLPLHKISSGKPKSENSPNPAPPATA